MGNPPYPFGDEHNLLVMQCRDAQNTEQHLLATAKYDLYYAVLI
jgi:hypothetical protein